LRWRLWLFKAVTAGVGILASLLTCELVLRVQEPFTHFMQQNFPKHPYISSDLWDHWPLPNGSFTFESLDPSQPPEPYSYLTNQYGCRHPARLAVPKPGTLRRVLVLGDSFTEGENDDDTLAVRLERRWDALPGAPPLEAVNCGCGSYSPLLEYLRLKYQLIQMQPDEIILNIDQTDVFDDYWRYRPSLRVGPDGEPLGMGQPWNLKRRTVKWLELHSDLARFLSGLRWRWMLRSSSASGSGAPQASPSQRLAPTKANIFMYHSTLPVDSPAWQREVGFCLDNISRIIRFAQQLRIPLTITMYPHRQQLQPDPGEKLWHREFEFRVQKLCRESGVPFFSAFEGISRAYRLNPHIFWSTDMHFTPDGERIWADLVTNYYVTQHAPHPASADARERPGQ
jgi:hypothetical protein